MHHPLLRDDWVFALQGIKEVYDRSFPEVARGTADEDPALLHACAIGLSEAELRRAWACRTLVALARSQAWLAGAAEAWRPLLVAALKNLLEMAARFRDASGARGPRDGPEGGVGDDCDYGGGDGGGGGGEDEGDGDGGEDGEDEGDGADEGEGDGDGGGEDEGDGDGEDEAAGEPKRGGSVDESLSGSGGRRRLFTKLKLRAAKAIAASRIPSPEDTWMQ